MTEETVESLKRELEAAELKRQLEETRYAVKSLKTANSVITEAQQPPLVDPFDGMYDDPEFSPVGGRGNYWQQTVDDRIDGKFMPVYDTELDLSRQRAQCNKVAFLDSIGVGALESLKDYTLGPGLKYLVASVDEDMAPEGLTDAIEDLISHILHINAWSGCLDREYHDRARTDGEYLSVIEWRNGDVYWREEEPCFLTEPMMSGELYDRFGSGDMDSWSFGVHTRMNRPDMPLGYHFVRNAEGTDWDYIPAERVSHYKRNVHRRAKRGVSDFWPIIGDIERNSKLRRNAGEGAALQAAIAWIRELPAGATNSAASSRVVSEATYKRSVRTVSGTADRHVRQFGPGSILTMTAGGKYHPGPMGAERNDGFVTVAQMLMRAIGVRWSLPEYLVSGDGSNGNFSSTTIQADSFVRARQSDQYSFGMADVDRLWKSLRMYFLRGKLDSFGMSWEEIRKFIKITPKGDDPSTKDPLGKREALQIETQNGWVSDETASRELGRNYDEEVEKGAERQANPNVQAANGGDPNAVDPNAGRTGDAKGGRPEKKTESHSMVDSLNTLFEKYGGTWT